MRDVLGDIQEEELPGCPNRALGTQVIKEANPHSYATMPKLQLAIARLKWHYGVNWVVQEFRRNPELRALATDPETGKAHEISQDGVRTACIWMIRGIPWLPGHRGGRCAMVNGDQIEELGDYLGERG
jgi:hypothetical protein